MKVYVNDEMQIKSVDEPKEGLMELEIIDDDPDRPNPFLGWSKAKICSYKVQVVDGKVIMMTPYRPSSTLDYIDEIGKQSEANEEKAQAFDIIVGEVEV